MPSWFPNELNMQMAYALCAAVGAVVVVLQIGLGVFGGDTDHTDFDVDLDTDAGLHLFSVRTLSAFLTIFGLVGLIGTIEEWPRGITFAAAFGSGSSVLLLVALLLRMQRKLHSSGSMVAGAAVGGVARVYLPIPAANKGVGKVTVVAQGRTNEYAAFTNGEALPAGSQVRLLRMTTPGVFEVAKLGEEKG